jgi:hypothetical protein
VLVIVASTAFLAEPASSLAVTPSFADWWGHFSARVQRDITRSKLRFTALKSLTFAAKAQAVRVCG